MKKFVKALLLVLVAFITLIAVLKYQIDYEARAATSIPMTTLGADLRVEHAEGLARKPLAPIGEPQHPFMAVNDSSVMHSGGWESDTHPASGVMGANTELRSRRAGGKAARQCATFTFTSEGYPLILCGGLTSFRLQLLDPESLDLLAFYDLPMRPSTFESLVKRDVGIIFSDTSGGAYFYLDNEDRAVLADSQQRIRRIKPINKGDKWQFVETDGWDMTPYVPNDCYHYNNLNPSGECDAITTVMPDYNGLLWWVTRNGRIGSLDTKTGKVVATDFDGEEVQNSFAIDESGAYVVTDHAMYRLQLVDGMPTRRWRLPYDRGTGRKVGSINQGSGTSPTLLGGGKYVTFTDNADAQIAVIVAHTGEVPEGKNRQICRVNLFAQNASATDNSMIGYDHSIIIENNHGYTNAQIHKDYGSVTGGVERIDINPDGSDCTRVWTSDIKVPSVVPKLSLGNGLVYVYTFDLLDNGDRLWSLAGIDFETGQTVLKVPTGTGIGYNNNWASIALAPNGDTYVGTRQGIVQMRDR